VTRQALKVDQRTDVSPFFGWTLFLSIQPFFSHLNNIEASQNLLLPLHCNKLFDESQ